MLVIGNVSININMGVYYRPHHSAWKNSCDSLTVVGLHENWALAFRCQVSAPPLAAEAASLIEKETVTVNGIFEIPNSKHQIPNKSQIRNTNANFSINPDNSYWIPAFAGMTADCKRLSFPRKRESRNCSQYMIYLNLLRTYQ